MKKFIYGAIMLFAIQTGFAQSQDAKTFVENMGVKANISGGKQEVLKMIDTGKVDDFNKEFDTLLNDFITSFSKLIDESYESSYLKEANKKFAETKEINVAEPKDSNAFQQKMGNLSNEIGMSMEGLIMKYASAEAFQQTEE